MQHTDHASFNESQFKSMHHILFNPTTGANEDTKHVKSCHCVTSDEFTNEASVEKDTDFRNIEESDAPFLSCLFNYAFDLTTLQEQ